MGLSFRSLAKDQSFLAHNSKGLLSKRADANNDTSGILSYQQEARRQSELHNCSTSQWLTVMASIEINCSNPSCGESLEPSDLIKFLPCSHLVCKNCTIRRQLETKYDREFKCFCGNTTESLELPPLRKRTQSGELIDKTVNVPSKGNKRIIELTKGVDDFRLLIEHLQGLDMNERKAILDGGLLCTLSTTLKAHNNGNTTLDTNSKTFFSTIGCNGEVPLSLAEQKELVGVFQNFSKPLLKLSSTKELDNDPLTPRRLLEFITTHDKRPLPACLRH